MQRTSDKLPTAELVLRLIYVVGSLHGCGFPQHEFASDTTFFAGGVSSNSVGGATAGGDGTGAGSGASHAGGSAGSDTTTPNAGAAGRMAEVCYNGMDDNGDGKVDCADPDCAPWVCLSKIPSGWKGPIVMASATSVTALPGCESSSGYPISLSSAWCSKMSTTMASCAPCPQCGSIASPDESIAVTFTSDCSGTCATNDSADCRFKFLTGCQRVELAQSSLAASVNPVQISLNVDAPVVSGGTCQGASPTGSLPAPLEEKCLEPIQICRGPSVGACASSEDGCMLRPAGPYGPAPCIYAESDQPTCPTGWDRLRRILYANIIDTRACTDCACSPPAAAYTNLSASVVDHGIDDTCQASSARAWSGAQGCTGRLQTDFGSTGISVRYLKIAIEATQSPCEASGGESVGKVEPQSPVTVCCTTL